MTTENKILVTLDGSERAKRTIDYLCRFKPLMKKQVVLFNISTPVPEAYYDLKKNPFSGSAVSRVKAWEMGQKKMIEGFMEGARMRLVSSGYDPDGVHINLAFRKKGIARDILAECKKGYEALVIRRRGSENSLLGLTLGGVAAKLVDKADSLPLIVAGIEPVQHALCIAVDGSEGAERAVRFVGRILGETGGRVVLCSVLRMPPFNLKEQVPDPFVGIANQAFEAVEKAVQRATDILVQSGVREDQVEVRVVRGAKSRAGALVDAARETGCDTLVFGRKGLSRVESFDLGRIPRKVIYGSRKLTVWLVP
ncbi:MAG: universal stress protein [Desulfobacter sp.]|nr:MAG: universal stress protein [Desulfobacter sp.]